MEFKKSIVYFYTVKKQLHIPIYRYMYNLRSKTINLFETKKQEVKNHKYANDLNYTLFTTSIVRIRKLHFLLEDFDSFRFVFIDGIYHYNRSLYKIVDLYYERFFSKEVAYLYFTEGAFVEKPIEILYISTGACTKSILFNTRNFIFLGKGSCVKIIESHKNLSLGKEKFSSVTEVYMNADSYLDFCKIKDDRPTTYFFDHTSIIQDNRSYCNINTFSFCGVSIMNFLSIYQLGKEIHSHINGLSILQEHIIHNTLIEHILPNGKSRDIYKGIFDKRANTNFNGKIIVLNEAKKTNAIQKSTNILLSNEAKVKANPQLEIFAEDVKCSHGCIVGQLNTQEIFYLRSRGIPKSEAISKKLFAFSKEVLEWLSFKKLKNLIKKEINKNVIPSRNS
ncbi:FeS assembly protein SufD [Candidatus Uzinura diaspidicola str. ASNER]|uniref:FeS assembly protein SufD n=1 Tax=Candidatus Uzinura diaspidicola str. ASNER TaxID=1133592 RepID=L7VK69_9FLAO|nr:FeS assembly protein SufD [Candidatus Uzinura diaspidicola str. ASNER]